MTPDKNTHIICDTAQLAAIDEPGSKAFRIHDQSIFVVKHAGGIFFYHNRCPHLGIELEWVEDQFLDVDNSLIQCSTHGALFVINSGECIYGPCLGQALEAIEHHIENDQVIVSLPHQL